MGERLEIAHGRKACDCRVVLVNAEPARWSPCRAHKPLGLFTFWAAYGNALVRHGRDERAACDDPRCRDAARRAP